MQEVLDIDEATSNGQREDVGSVQNGDDSIEVAAVELHDQEVRYVKVLYEYSPDEDDELHLVPNQVIRVFGDMDEDRESLSRNPAVFVLLS